MGRSSTAKIPIPWLEVYAEALPRLQAEENLNAYTVSVLGDAKKYDRDRILRAWRRAAGRTKAAPKARTIEEHMAMVASFGITAVIITDSGEKVPVPPGPESPDGSIADPEDCNITSAGFPESGI